MRPLAKISITVLALTASILLLVPQPAEGQVDFGVRGGIYGDDAFVGAELLFPLQGSWYLNPNVEWVFVDNGDLFSVNGDVHYDFETGGNYYAWGGGGLALLFRDFDRPRFRDDDSETDVGVNLLGGLGFNPGGALRPYVQGKITLADDTEGSIAFGVRF